MSKLEADYQLHNTWIAGAAHGAESVDVVNAAIRIERQVRNRVIRETLESIPVKQACMRSWENELPS